MQDYISIFTRNWDMLVQITILQECLVLRTHGNKSRQPRHALRVGDIQHVGYKNLQHATITI